MRTDKREKEEEKGRQRKRGEDRGKERKAEEEKVEEKWKGRVGSMEQKTEINDALKHVYSVYIHCIYF